MDFPDLDREGLRLLGDRLKGAEGDLAVVLFGRGEPGSDASGVPFVALCQGAALEHGLKAGDLAKVVKGHLGGGGGGKPASAQGRGEDPDAVTAELADRLQRLVGALSERFQPEPLF